ncbi:VPA1269 family protein [Acinetobacter sp. Leaf130]|uniref:gamma-mobile-trio integrase GmtZ n=1 Tax=Acinetobacter sp. Leaf130 TaxID=1736269 RepID=UPI0006FAA33C|nr:VPA1269 family protein [Acinetobacter sp. Leaf130]KQQ76750.1 integrase [Acinetobacter sp. Leaf130]
MSNKEILKRKKNDGRCSDLTFQWLIKNRGIEWDIWRQLAEEWITKQDGGVSNKLDALCLFFDIYLVDTLPFTTDVVSFFDNKNGRYASIDEFKSILLKKTKRSDNRQTTRLLIYTKHFIDWLLDTHFSEKNECGVPLRFYANPFEVIKVQNNANETVYNPLPYRYICNLRKILCPKQRGNFSDWSWAQENAIDSIQGSDWFEVEKNQIDENDKDCVWRNKKITRNGEITNIYQIWSPIISMVLYIKLHLPLRTYQIRMLDSGESDSIRYENGKWIKNTHALALSHHRKGVFRQFKDNASGLESTGLYINTNKTADQNRDEFERGYEIPWQNENVLYWLEKLRNWQEKYNPINKPTDCLTLERRHTGLIKSKANLKALGHICFLFRDARANNAKDRDKPIQEMSIQKCWYKLLQQLENNLLISGDTLSNGKPLRLVHRYRKDHSSAKTKTEFPLHSLRVSLITSYIVDAQLPLPVVSKLLAGHSRLIMTIYYTKLTPTVIKDKMTEAEKLLDSKAQESVKVFLKDAEMRQIECKMAYNDSQAIEAALINRNPLGWENRHHGICLVGGNTVRTNEHHTVAGCWNGGALLKDSTNISRRIYSSVPHGFENCVRCRWFITDARYLPALNAHLNFMSYKAHQAANLAINLEYEIEKIDESKYQAECAGKAFTKHNELQTLQRRYEKQLVEADECTKDWIATFKLIRRIIEIEQKRTENDAASKLIAVGTESDIKVGFIETKSELLHLSLLCDDAEFYPDMLDEVRKTPAIERLTQSLSRLMMSKNYTPHLLMFDQQQQLIAINAMMRQMALQEDPTNKIEGYKKVANHLEFEQYMQNSKLLDIGIKALENNIKQKILKLSTSGLKQKKYLKEQSYEH